MHLGDAAKQGQTYCIGYPLKEQQSIENVLNIRAFIFQFAFIDKPRLSCSGRME